MLNEQLCKLSPQRLHKAFQFLCGYTPLLTVKEPHSGTQVPKRGLALYLSYFQSFFCLLELGGFLNMGHLISVKLFQHLLNGTNRVAQITVAFLTNFGNDAGLFRGDETARFQRLDMFAHRAAAPLRVLRETDPAQTLRWGLESSFGWDHVWGSFDTSLNTFSIVR